AAARRRLLEMIGHGEPVEALGVGELPQLAHLVERAAHGADVDSEVHAEAPARSVSARYASLARSSAGRLAVARHGASIASGAPAGSAATSSASGKAPSPGSSRPVRASRISAGVSVGAGISADASQICA